MPLTLCVSCQWQPEIAHFRQSKFAHIREEARRGFRRVPPPVRCGAILPAARGDLENLGNGRFRDVSRLAGDAVQQLIAARGAAFGNIDNDGDVDIIVNPVNAIPELLRNDAQGLGNWLQVKLVGKRSNRSAIGARIVCVTGEIRQVREVRSGGSYYSQNDLRLHFGVGEAEVIEVLEIRWPSGHIDRLRELKVNQLLTVEERQQADSETSP